MYDCKIMFVDGLPVLLGATNFNNRSFHFNNEANLNTFDRAFDAATPRFSTTVCGAAN